MKNFSVWLALPFLFFGSLQLFADPFVIPPLSSPVTDLAGVVDASTKQQLEGVLSRVFESGGPQITVLTVPTLGDGSIEDISIKIVDEWKLGRKGKDDGLLLLVVPTDRKVRIEVGRGLEGVVTDAMSRRIIREVLTPSFRSGDYSGGIANGVYALVSLSAPEFDLTGAGVSRASSRGGSKNSLTKDAARSFLMVFFFGLIIIISVVSRIMRAFGLIPRSSVNGGRGWGGSGWSGGGGGFGGGGGGWSGGGGGFSGGGSSGSW